MFGNAIQHDPVYYGFYDLNEIPVPGDQKRTATQIMARDAQKRQVYGHDRLQAMAESKGISLEAAADYMGPGAIEVPRFESQILDMTRGRGALGQRIKEVPANGHPTRYFEQVTIAQGAFSDPRTIVINPETPKRAERFANIKCIGGGVNFTLFDVEITRLQNQFPSLLGKDVQDLVKGMLRTSDKALWRGTDTDLLVPATTQYVGGITQINRKFVIGSGVSAVDAIGTEAASLVSSEDFDVRPSAIYAHPLTIDQINQEERLNHRYVSPVPLVDRDGRVIAGIMVSVIQTGAGLLPLIPEIFLPKPIIGGSVNEPGKTDYPLFIISEDLVEYQFVTTAAPRLFVQGLESNLATQYVGAMFGCVIFKGRADVANSPETNIVTYAHSQGQLVR